MDHFYEIGVDLSKSIKIIFIQRPIAEILGVILLLLADIMTVKLPKILIN